jgi:hypothetical protein
MSIETSERLGSAAAMASDAAGFTAIAVLAVGVAGEA